MIVRPIDLEGYLKTWIERDPALLQSGLTIVGRQEPVEVGRLHLLPLGRQGRSVVIEITLGGVRRQVVAQACIPTGAHQCRRCPASP